MRISVRDMQSLQSFLRTWPPTGRPKHFMRTVRQNTSRMRTVKTRMLGGTASSTYWLFPTKYEVQSRPWLRSKGSSTLPQAMFDSLPKDVQDRALFESPVTAISRDVKDRRVMRISIKGVQSSQEYSAVICTVPLPCLSLMDLTGVNINDNYAQWNAIRELQYGPAIKIGLKFSSAWWETLDQPIHGGQSQTDLPLRTM